MTLNFQKNNDKKTIYVHGYDGYSTKDVLNLLDNAKKPDWLQFSTNKTTNHADSIIRCFDINIVYDTPSNKSVLASAFETDITEAIVLGRAFMLVTCSGESNGQEVEAKKKEICTKFRQTLQMARDLDQDFVEYAYPDEKIFFVDFGQYGKDSAHVKIWHENLINAICSNPLQQFSNSKVDQDGYIAIDYHYSGPGSHKEWPKMCDE